ncbi:MAG: hypothetical protein H0W59_08865, partial [Chloroflexia bacterium]|nr:hypothetical protein [Chloroflexia bacterium]
QIPSIGRATQGVTLMRMDRSEQVRTMTIVEEKDENEDDGLSPTDGQAIELTGSNGTSDN